jgi:methionyl-tRNA formyltransferase
MKYVFFGNRRFVLEEMLKKNLDVDILVVKGTHLEREKFLNNYPHKIISSKEEFLEYLDDNDFDVLVSNGCPYILPISKMKARKYVNIHPSYLPDLKGIDPAHGSILFKRDGGAACHFMTDEIDDGDIISRIKIPYSSDLDVSLLYQLGFVAEKQVFNEALNNGFTSTVIQEKRDDLLYYSRKPEDKIINFNESNEQIEAKIKAFNNYSQGCSFIYKGEEFKTYDIDFLTNSYLKNYSLGFQDLEIIFVYEDCILLKKDGELLKLGKIKGSLEKVQVNSLINEK